MYGGWDGHTAHNTLHILNVDNLIWREMKSGDTDELPMKMSGCGLVAHGDNKLVLFGGYGLPSGTSKRKGKEVNLVTTSSKGSQDIERSVSPTLSQGGGGVAKGRGNEEVVSLGEGSSVVVVHDEDGGRSEGSVVVVNEGSVGGEGDGEGKGGVVEGGEKEPLALTPVASTEEEEEEKEVLALIDKRWTNELKVYDIQSGKL